MSLRAARNDFAGRHWPAGRTLRTPALDRLLNNLRHHRPISHQCVGRTGDESNLHLFLNVFQVLDELQRIIQPNNAHYISEMRKRWDDFYSKVQFYGVMKKVTVYSTLICPSLYFEISWWVVTHTALCCALCRNSGTCHCCVQSPATALSIQHFAT